jgi:hypothetical protein
VSEVGFEPTPTEVDQNAHQPKSIRQGNLESGALDRSAILTYDTNLSPDIPN